MIVPPATASDPSPEGLTNELDRVRQQLSLSEDLLVYAPAGTRAHARAGTAYDRLSAEASLIEEVIWTQSVFDGATPGSPAQFRAREASDALRWKLDQLRSG